MFEGMPDRYLEMTGAEVVDRIRAHKERLGRRLVILGHHYQADDVISFSDFRGDSFGLSRQAAARTEAEFIVFCGVDFMAQSAEILAGPDQVVQHPDRRAGCPMADMASVGEVEEAWRQIGRECDTADITPVTYMNSDATLKAFCGRHGGAVCTSSNAGAIYDWSFDQREKIFFFPDEHLGRNTANVKGVPKEQVVLWDPSLPLGGSDARALRRARVILWKGFCHVHTWFTVEQIDQARTRWSGARVIVHPECIEQVVDAADAAGSTEQIIRYCADAPAGSTVVVGTEIHMVSRLAREYDGRRIFELSRSSCPNMQRINTRNLLWTLDHPGEVNVVRVDEAVRLDARIALERMLENSPSK